jgi:hypothetical protein
MPLPQNEKGGIRRKIANAASIIYSTVNEKAKASEFQEKVGTIPKMGRTTRFIRKILYAM